MRSEEGGPRLGLGLEICLEHDLVSYAGTADNYNMRTMWVLLPPPPYFFTLLSFLFIPLFNYYSLFVVFLNFFPVLPLCWSSLYPSNSTLLLFWSSLYLSHSHPPSLLVFAIPVSSATPRICPKPRKGSVKKETKDSNLHHPKIPKPQYQRGGPGRNEATKAKTQVVQPAKTEQRR